MGKLIVVEGINGAGKTSLIEALADKQTSYLIIKNKDAPQYLHQLVMHHPTSFTMFLAIIIERRGWIKQLCTQYQVVFQDRAFLSEATHLPNARRRINTVMTWFFSYLYLPPALLVLIDTPATVALKRIQDREKSSSYIAHILNHPDILEERRLLLLKKFNTYTGNKVLVNGVLPLDMITHLVNERIQQA